MTKPEAGGLAGTLSDELIMAPRSAFAGRVYMFSGRRVSFGPNGDYGTVTFLKAALGPSCSSAHDASAVPSKRPASSERAIPRSSGFACHRGRCARAEPVVTLGLGKNVCSHRATHPHDRRATGIGCQRSGDVRQKRRLTKEQEELRLGGLRILARLIARRCLADLQPDVGRLSEAVGRAAPGEEAAREEKAA